MSAQESDKRDKRTTFSGVRTCLAFCEGCKHLSEQKKPVECREWNTEVKPETEEERREREAEEIEQYDESWRFEDSRGRSVFDR